MNRLRVIDWLLRISLAFTFFYVAISTLINPFAWIGFFPSFIQDLMSMRMLELLLAITHTGLGIWLLSRYRSLEASIVSGVYLLGVVVFNLGSLDIVFRDLSLVLVAVALAVLTKQGGVASH